MDIKKVLIKNPSLLETKEKIKSIFSDIYGSKSLEVGRLLKLYELIIDKNQINADFNKKNRIKYINKLIYNEDMVEDRAEWVVDEWLKIIDDEVKNSYISYIAMKEKKKASEQNKSKIKTTQVNQEDEDKIDFQGFENLPSEDDFERFINPVRSKQNDIIIPCGVGMTDRGFMVCGTGISNFSGAKLLENQYNRYYDPIYALVYNYIIRNTRLSDKDIPKSIINEIKQNDFRLIYRYMVIIIIALKCDLINNGRLDLVPIDHVEEFKLAFKAIKNYVELFCRLANKKIPALDFIYKSSNSVSLEKEAKIYVKNLDKYSNSRYLATSTKIAYSLNQNSLKDLTYILSEISPYASFKEGQLESIIKILNDNSHFVCIMPTGSGKSLIYYFISILQPQPILVISPNDILINDQIRNLQKIHRIDNVSHLMLRENYFKDMEICNSINYLTPITFQNRNLFARFRKLNEIENKVAAIILDEIHCLSSWGHDFRPEYLMLSNNIKTHLDRTKLVGFTATANYTVVKDIQKQLDINENNFISPIKYDKYNAEYYFKDYDTTDLMIDGLVSIVNQVISKDERAIVFTKKDDISNQLGEILGDEADVFTNQNVQAYYLFADNYSNILITTEEIGIGINFENVTNIIHFGLPASKSDYVQQIGRAGRNEETIRSYVLYLKPTQDNVDEQLLKRDTLVNKISSNLSKMDNDYSDIFSKMNMNADTSDVLYDRLIDKFSDYKLKNQPLYKELYDISTLQIEKKYLYMLFVTGYIRDWYANRIDKSSKKVEILLDIKATNNEYYNDEANMLQRMRNTLMDYIKSMDGDKKTLAKINKENKLEGIIKIYVEWYYSHYLYHHKEEFLDTFDFIQSNRKKHGDSITEQIEGYFVLPFVKIREEKDKFINMGFEDIPKALEKGISRDSLTNIERINSNQYNLNLDYVLLLANMKLNERIDEGRLERIWNKLNSKQRTVMLEVLIKKYPILSDEEKWKFLKVFENGKIKNVTYEDIVNKIYTNGYTDFIYYVIIAHVFNEAIKGGK